jgi:hypothetical protein
MADREDLGPPGNAQIGVHLDASSAIVLGADLLGRRRGDDTSGPDHRGRLDTAAIERNALLVAAGDLAMKGNLDTPMPSSERFA